MAGPKLQLQGEGEQWAGVYGKYVAGCTAQPWHNRQALACAGWAAGQPRASGSSERCLEPHLEDRLLRAAGLLLAWLPGFGI